MRSENVGRKKERSYGSIRRRSLSGLWAVREWRWISFFMLLPIVLAGCATSRDLDNLRVEMNDQLSTTSTKISQHLRGLDQNASEVGNRMNGLEAEFTKFSAEQRAKLNARIEDVRSSLASLEQQVETFGTLKEGLQEVQTDIALLKPLGLMLEKVEAQLESTHAEVETLIDRMAANKRELGNFDKTLGGIKATQREMGGQIDHLVKTVDFIEKGMVERIHAEVRLAKESIKQLEQTLKLLEPIQIHQKIETSVSEPTG